LCIGEEFSPEKVSEESYLYQRVISPNLYPTMEIEFLGSDRATRSKGLGELPFATIPPAFYSALTQAIGLEPQQLPLQGSDILKRLEEE
ncbi:MAG TPA: hypothetical protein PKJ53_07715, partial [Spirochaetales bacterium]|nr:hypothetical protein [Spirochaetales bacterium]